MQKPTPEQKIIEEKTYIETSFTSDYLRDLADHMDSKNILLIDISYDKYHNEMIFSQNRLETLDEAKKRFLKEQ